MNDDELLKAKIKALKVKGATPDELAAFVDEWDRTHKAQAAPVDRVDQTTVRNPEGQDPVAKYGPIAAGLAAGVGAGAGAELLLAKLAARGLLGAIGTGAASNVAAGAVTRGTLAPKGERMGAAFDPSGMATDAAVGGAFGGVTAGGVKALSSVAKNLGLFREKFGAEEAGKRLVTAGKKMGVAPKDFGTAATGRVGDDALLLNAGEPTSQLARDAVRDSRVAHEAVLPALNRQQLGAKDRARALVEQLFGKSKGTLPEMQRALDAGENARVIEPAYEAAHAAHAGPITDPVVLDAIKRGEAALPAGEPASITEDLTKLAPHGSLIRTPAGPPSDAQVAQWLTQTHGVPANRITPAIIAQARPIAEQAGLASDAEMSLRYAAELKSRLGKTAGHESPMAEVPKHATHSAAQRTDETTLRDALHAAYPEYANADALKATNFAQQDALKSGYTAGGAPSSSQGIDDFLHTTRDNARPGSERLAQGAFRQGQRAKYMDKIEAASPAADPLNSVLGTDAQKALIEKTAQNNRASQLGPTLEKEQMLRGDAAHVGEPLVPKEGDIALDPGEWSIRQGYVGNVAFPAADVAAKFMKGQRQRVGRAADDVIGRIMAGSARDPQAIAALQEAVSRASQLQAKRAARARWLASILGTASGTTFDRP